jgi:hypothetical protein
MQTIPTKLEAKEWNDRFTDERVAHIGQPATSPCIKELWRTTDIIWGGRSTQINPEGDVRTVDTDALYKGGNLKAKYIGKGMTETAKGVFTLMEEEL